MTGFNGNWELCYIYGLEQHHTLGNAAGEAVAAETPEVFPDSSDRIMVSAFIQAYKDGRVKDPDAPIERPSILVPIWATGQNLRRRLNLSWFEKIFQDAMKRRN